MKTNPVIAVTLSDELMENLRVQAERLGIPMKWLVAGLVCDTIESAGAPNDDHPARPTRHVA